MSKAIVNMTDWELYVYEERYNLSGRADHHPALGKNIYVARTTSMVNYSFEEDVLTYETRNTIYVCPLKYMSPQPYRNVVERRIKELVHQADGSDSILDKIVAASAKLSILNSEKKANKYAKDVFLKHVIELQTLGQQEIAELKQREQNRLIGLACKYENSIYLEVSNVNCGDLLAYHLGDCSGVVEPRLHSGMFQDSILYMKYAGEEDPCSLDFRYFPKGWEDTMETYSWSDNIETAVIKNDTDDKLWFNGEEILPGETKQFTPEGC